VVGAGSGVQYVALGGFSPTQLNSTVPTNLRVVNIAGGNLYVSAGSSTYYGLSMVGTGLPTTSGQTATLLPGFPGSGTSATSSAYGFYFADLSSTVPGLDVVYVADDRTSGGGIQKWSLVSGTWTLNGTIANAGGIAVRSLDGNTSGTTVSLVAVGAAPSSATGLYMLSDNTGYNVAPSLAAIPAATVTLASTTNMALRGVAFAPTVPAPTITSFTPTNGQSGATVTITGTDFTGATAVTLNGVAITGFTVVNGTTITFTVPAGATSGAIAVTTASGTATSTGTFTVDAVPNPLPNPRGWDGSAAGPWLRSLAPSAAPRLTASRRRRLAAESAFAGAPAWQDGGAEAPDFMFCEFRRPVPTREQLLAACREPLVDSLLGGFAPHANQ